MMAIKRELRNILSYGTLRTLAVGVTGEKPQIKMQRGITGTGSSCSLLLLIMTKVAEK